jgi:PhnB protein
MQIANYLHFNGQCEEAFQLYAKVLGGKIAALFTHGGTPVASQVPAEWHSKVMHAHLAFGDQAILGTDVPPSMYQKPTGFSVSVSVKDPAEAERIFTALSDGATITMAIQQTFWSPRFGMLTDRFGIPWMINTDQPMPQ